MKIYFVGQKGIPAQGGGIERYVEDLSIRLIELGHEVSVYTRPYYTSKQMVNYRGVKLISLPSLRTKHLDAISHCFLASFDVLWHRPDVVYYQNIGPALTAWIPKLFSRTKVVSILQSQDYFHQKWGWFARTSLRLGELVMCLVSDEVIVVTGLMQDYVMAKYGRSAHLIPNGANLPLGAKQSDMLAKWGLAEGNYIVSISRLVRHKGIHYLIEAYKKLETDKRLVIVGEGAFTDNYVSELKALAEGDPRILFLGNQTGETLTQLYANAYVFVQPSEAEGLSLALLEAMANNRAVLASDIAENLEAIGESGMTFKSKNIDDLKHKLVVLLSDEAAVKQLGQSARQRIEERFNWEKIAHQISLVFSANDGRPTRCSSISHLYKYLCRFNPKH